MMARYGGRGGATRAACSVFCGCSFKVVVVGVGVVVVAVAAVVAAAAVVVAVVKIASTKQLYSFAGVCKGVETEYAHARMPSSVCISRQGSDTSLQRLGLPREAGHWLESRRIQPDEPARIPVQTRSIPSLLNPQH